MKKNAWSKKELAELRRIWPNGTPEQVGFAVDKASIVSEAPLRNWGAIKKQASRMHLRKSPRYMKRVLHRTA